ncbi:MAG: hypothetical protein V3R32_04175 [Nitrosomonadaceae bacterium]
MAPDEAIKLKSSRTGKLSSLTKRMQKAETLIKSKVSISVISEIKSEISVIVAECEKANDLYIETMTEEHEVLKAYEWFFEAETRAKDCLDEILIYVDSEKSLASTSVQQPNMLNTTSPLPPSVNTMPANSATISPASNSPYSSASNLQPKPESLDAWIDELIPYKETVVECPDPKDESSYQSLMLRAMFERDSPKPEIETFDGSPLKWPKFVESFFENVHRQPYFRDVRRMSILQSRFTVETLEYY